MKFHLGQKIRIITKPPKSPCGGPGWNNEMTKYCNSIATIEKYAGDFGRNKMEVYHLIENGWNWREDWLLLLSIFKPGDTVKSKSTGEILLLNDSFTWEDSELELVARKNLL